MLHISRATPMLVGLVAVLTYAGCGSGDASAPMPSASVASTSVAVTTPAHSSKGSGGQLTRTALVAAADNICKGVIAHRAAAAEKFTSDQEIVTQAPILANYERVAFTTLAKLVPPPAMAHDWTRIAGYSRTYASDAAKWGAYIAEKRIKAAYKQIFLTMGQIDGQIRAIAHHRGLHECGRM